MRSSRIPLRSTLGVVLALLAFAAPANAVSQDLRSPDTRDAAAAATQPQDLRSPDTRDIARTQDLRHLAGGIDTSSLAGTNAARAQERYYSSYGTPAATQPKQSVTDDGTPWAVVVFGLAGAFLVAGAIAFAGRTRRRTARVRIAA
jgi:hypothetical protein